jgi:hypothetical protein
LDRRRRGAAALEILWNLDGYLVGGLVAAFMGVLGKRHWTAVVRCLTGAVMLALLLAITYLLLFPFV